MAYIRKHNDGWRAEVQRKGIRRTKVFETKRQAQNWAARQEYLIDNGDTIAARETFGDVLDRYAREVSPAKRGERWEVIRIDRLRRDPIARVRMGDLTPQDFANWRDSRMREVSAGTVRREMVLLSAVLNVARKEWGLIRDNPISDVRRPPPPRPRDRLPTPDEMERLAAAAGADLTKATARAFHAFRFASETAMRAGEICGLTWDRLDLERRVARLDRTKNGQARAVPLSTEAVKLIEALPHADPVFGLSTAQLDSLWRKVRGRAGVEGLTFHDSRAAGTTKLASKVDVLTLARITGHKNIQMLMVYYRESPEDIAKRLG